MTAAEQLTGQKDAYTTHVPDNSMKPRYVSGHMLWIAPSRSIAPGDGVLIIMKDRHAVAREFVEQSPRQLVVKRYYPELKFDVIDREEVAHVHRIVGVIDSIALVAAPSRRKRGPAKKRRARAKRSTRNRNRS
jgi:phage repressor protein C with HTH and peptisase S24 domain